MLRYQKRLITRADSRAICCRVTLDDYALVQACAKARGMTISDMLREGLAIQVEAWQAEQGQKTEE